MIQGLEKALGEVADLLDRLGRPYAVAGGLAVAAWGVPRATRDVDAYVALDAPSDRDAVRRGLEGLGYHVPAMEREIEEMGVFRSRSPDGVFLDLFNATGPLGEAILAGRRAVRLADRSIWYVAPEELAVLKAFSDRPRDHEDLAALMAVMADRLDLDRVRRWARRIDAELGAGEVMERLQRAQQAAGG